MGSAVISRNAPLHLDDGYSHKALHHSGAGGLGNFHAADRRRLETESLTVCRPTCRRNLLHFPDDKDRGLSYIEANPDPIMNVRICFKPVRLGGSKDEPKSTYELQGIDDRILREYRSYLETGKPVGGAYGEDDKDFWFHVDFREVAFMVPVEASGGGVNPLAEALQGLPPIPGLTLG
jgi:hypothetical protein